jgi:signal transduction histidine kinase/ActR/RegA family two-component response regulator
MLLMVFIIVLIAIPILRYRLFDIEIVINRTLVYGTLTVLLGSLYFLLVRLLTLVAQIAARYQNESLVVFLATMSIALAANPLRQRVQDLIDRAFYRQKLNYQRLLPEMAGRLTTSILPDQLTQLMTEELPRRLQIQKASLLVLDPGGRRLDPLHAGAQSTRPVDFLLIEVLKRLAQPFLRLQPSSRLPEALLGWLEVNRIELVIPLMVGEELVGVYSLGPKSSGDVYNAEEVRLLNLLGQQAAVGIQNSRLFQAEQRQRKLAEALGERMTRLANEARRRAAQQAALNEVIAIAVTAPDLDHLLEEALDLTLQALELNMGALWVVDKMVSRGLSPDFRQAITQTVEARGAEVSVVMMMDDWETAGENQRSQAEDHKMRAWLEAPVLAGGVSIGALCVVSVIPRDWHPVEVALVEAIGRQLGGAVERLDLLARTQEQARQVQQIIDTVPEGVLLLDGNQEVILANPAAWQHLVHLTGQDCVGQPLPSLTGLPVGRLLDDDSERPWHEVISEGPLRRIFEMAAHPLQSQSGGSGWVLVMRDVTIERETQAQIQMQERLATVGQLAAGIAHDFNNIMAAILVYADLLTLEADVSDMGRERLDIIQNQIRRATSLIRQILDFSRRGVMEKSVLDLLPLVKELEKLLQRVLPESIRLKLVHQPGEYLVDADPACLQQVFMNLSLNARDAMPSGGTLRFELSRFKLQAGERPPYPDLTPGDWIQINVHDTGTGIPVNIQSRVFDPFFTTKPVGKGTGLGLAQVYGIVKGHGGSIDLQSKIGEGTTFSIYLPRQTAPVEERPEAESVSSIGTGQTVLVVEDDQVTCKAMCDLLESMNYRVLVAANGVDAIQIYDCESETIQLVVCDVVMPEMGGMSLYETLKEKAPQLKVVFVSGHPFSIEDQSILEGGQVHWLQKPFSAREFAALVERMLDE